jgi:hypothetical protein
VYRGRALVQLGATRSPKVELVLMVAAGAALQVWLFLPYAIESLAHGHYLHHHHYREYISSTCYIILATPPLFTVRPQQQASVLFDYLQLTSY